VYKTFTGAVSLSPNPMEFPPWLSSDASKTTMFSFASGFRLQASLPPPPLPPPETLPPEVPVFTAEPL